MTETETEKKHREKDIEKRRTQADERAPTSSYNEINREGCSAMAVVLTSLTGLQSLDIG